MTTLIECIPNVSEGRRPEVVAAIRNAAVAAGPGVLLLDWTSDADHNRSVLTFLGDGPALVAAMEAMVAEALVHIDLTRHEGAHPRLGAVDVIPFVPIRGATAADCVALARVLGARLAEKHGLPVYLYEDAATSEPRRNLATIRKGEFEGLAEKMKSPDWKPDFGPEVPHPTAGATVVGARSPSSPTTSTSGRRTSPLPTGSPGRSATSPAASASSRRWASGSRPGASSRSRST